MSRFLRFRIEIFDERPLSDSVVLSFEFSLFLSAIGDDDEPLIPLLRVLAFILDKILLVLKREKKLLLKKKSIIKKFNQ